MTSPFQDQDLRTALGEPFMTAHSGCEGGPFVKLKYETLAETQRAHTALYGFFRAAPPRPVDAERVGLREFAKAILHGDDDHRAWLTEAAEAFISGDPMPPPRGKGTSPAHSLDKAVTREGLDTALRLVLQVHALSALTRDEREDIITDFMTAIEVLAHQPTGTEAAWKCAAKGDVGANDPQDCDWPMCGCDPHADKVIAALQECGHLVSAPPAQAPDKACEREGVSEEHCADLVSLRNHLESEGHVHDADAISAVLKILALKPPGTEAMTREGVNTPDITEADMQVWTAIQYNDEAHRRAGARYGLAFERVFHRLCLFYGYEGDWRGEGTMEAALTLAPQPTGTKASRGVIPAGWKLAPVQPTAEMQEAGSKAVRAVTLSTSLLIGGMRIPKHVADHLAAEAIKAAFAATPTPPVSPTPDSTGPAGRPIEEAPRDGTPIIAWGAPSLSDPDDFEWRQTRWTLYGEGSIAHARFKAGQGPEGYWSWSEPMHNWGSSWEPTRFIDLPAALTPSAPIAAAVRGDGAREALKALRPLSERATQREWKSHGRYIGTVNHMSCVGEVRDENGNWSDTAKSTKDAAFIAAAVNYVRLVLAATPASDVPGEIDFVPQPWPVGKNWVHLYPGQAVETSPSPAEGQKEDL